MLIKSKKVWSSGQFLPLIVEVEDKKIIILVIFSNLL